MSHRTVRPPTDQECERLEEMTQHEIGRVAMRAHMILLSCRGYSAYEIAEIHNVTDPTVYKWIDRFDQEGPDGLFDAPRAGRPPKIDEQAEDEIERVLQAPPTEEGYQASRSTARRLAEHLEKELGIEVHPETVRSALDRLAFSWKRPRRSLPEDPNYDERMQELLEVIAGLDPETTLLFEDETDLKRFPPLRRMWMPRGEQWSVEVPERNDKFTLYGAFDPLTGQTFIEPYPKGKSEHTKAFLRHVLNRVEGDIVLVWDHASWHTSKAVEGLLDAHDRLGVVLLPKRAPEANPVEDLWRVLKNTVAACLMRSLDELKTACLRFFEKLSPQDTLRIAGLC